METLYRKVEMTLEEVKEQVAKGFTGGKHTWYDGYLNKSIKVILMDSVAKIYASQFETKLEKLETEKAELLEALEKLLYGEFFNNVEEQDFIEYLIQKHKQ